MSKFGLLFNDIFDDICINIMHSSRIDQGFMVFVLAKRNDINYDGYCVISYSHTRSTSKIHQKDQRENSTSFKHI